jgi:hypothetical protein
MPRARKPQQPQVKIGNTAVVGVHKPREPLAGDEHHLGFDRALEHALATIGRTRGRYQVQVQFSAVVDVQNPGRIVEYRATLI